MGLCEISIYSLSVGKRFCELAAIFNKLDQNFAELCLRSVNGVCFMNDRRTLVSATSAPIYCSLIYVLSVVTNCLPIYLRDLE